MDNQHGGNISAFAKQLNTHPSEIIDLSSNINFIKPDIKIDFNSLEISAYPNYEALERSIAQLYEVKREEVELYNGATSAIYALFRRLNLAHTTLYAPLYGEYEKAAKASNYTIHYINRFEKMHEEVEENSLVVFVNPSTPDGHHYKMESLILYWIERNCTILVDESFLDFTDHPSSLYFLKDYPKLYILKSMTKFYAAAGIRIGAIISVKENIEKLKQYEPLWKISQFDSHYLQSALQDPNFEKKTKNITTKNKEYLITLFQQFKYTETIYPSSSNFILVKLKGLTAETFQEKLLYHKIMIRNCANFHLLNNAHIRVAVKSKENLQLLAQALLEIK